MQIIEAAGRIGRARKLLLLVALLAVSVLSVGSAKSASAEELSGRYIVVLNGSVDHPGMVATEHARRYGLDLGHVFRHALNGYAARIPAQKASSLRGNLLALSSPAEYRESVLRRVS